MRLALEGRKISRIDTLRPVVNTETVSYELFISHIEFTQLVVSRHRKDWSAYARTVQFTVTVKDPVSLIHRVEVLSVLLSYQKVKGCKE